MQKRNYAQLDISELPVPVATRFVEQLCEPDQRFARAFRFYWSRVRGQDDVLAEENTLEELLATRTIMLADLADPCVHSIGYYNSLSDKANTYIPVGVYSLRDLASHPMGLNIQAILNKPKLRNGYRGKLAIAHSVSVLNEHASVRVLAHIFLLIALRAIRAQYSYVFFYSSDLRLRGTYRRFGIEFPDGLDFDDSEHLVGVYNLKKESNRSRIDEAFRNSFLSDPHKD